MLTLLASFAQEESRSISESIKWAKSIKWAIRKKFEQGIPNTLWLQMGWGNISHCSFTRQNCERDLSQIF